MNGFARKLSLTQRQKVLGSGIIKLYKRYKDIWLACLIQTLLVKTWFFSSWKTEMKTEMIQFEYHFTKQNQEIIKVREWIFHIGLTSKVSPLKLFIDIVPSSSEDITRASRGCFLGKGSAYVISFHFVSKQKITSNEVEMFLITSKRAWALGNTFRILEIKLEMDASCTNSNNWVNGKEMPGGLNQRAQCKQTFKHKLGNRTGGRSPPKW